MGLCFCFKCKCTISLEKSKKDKQTENASKKSSDSKWERTSSEDDSIKDAQSKQLTEDAAAIRIQSAFRAYRARNALRRLKGIVRFRRAIEEGRSVKNHATAALNRIHFRSRLQAEIKARWVGMVDEGRRRQKRLENQSKFEARLRELEVEWNGNPKSKEEILNSIQQREAAAARRERTMAYAFSHQWRPNPNQYLGQANCELSKESWGWGWSWRERWIAFRPFENGYQTRPTIINKVKTDHKRSVVTNSATTTKIV